MMLKDLEHLVWDFIKCLNDSLEAIGVENSYNKKCHSLKEAAFLLLLSLEGSTSSWMASHSYKICKVLTLLLNAYAFSPLVCLASVASQLPLILAIESYGISISHCSKSCNMCYWNCHQIWLWTGIFELLGSKAQVSPFLLVWSCANFCFHKPNMSMGKVVSMC